jgi:hypothetical protein
MEGVTKKGYNRGVWVGLAIVNETTNGTANNNKDTNHDSNNGTCRNGLLLWCDGQLSLLGTILQVLLAI